MCGGEQVGVGDGCVGVDKACPGFAGDAGVVLCVVCFPFSHFFCFSFLFLE